MELKSYKITMSLKKMKQLLKTKGVTDYRDKSSRGLSGLKRITDNEEEGNYL